MGHMQPIRGIYYVVVPDGITATCSLPEGTYAAYQRDIYVACPDRITAICSLPEETRAAYHRDVCS